MLRYICVSEALPLVENTIEQIVFTARYQSLVNNGGILDIRISPVLAIFLITQDDGTAIIDLYGSNQESVAEMFEALPIAIHRA